MDMAVAYEMIVVNMHNARSSIISAYSINDISYESDGQSGVCLLFDNKKNIDKVVSSSEDILNDAIMEIESFHTHYCMIYDDSMPMSEEEIDFVYDGIDNGSLNIILIEDETHIGIHATLN